MNKSISYQTFRRKETYHKFYYLVFGVPSLTKLDKKKIIKASYYKISKKYDFTKQNRCLATLFHRHCLRRIHRWYNYRLYRELMQSWLHFLLVFLELCILIKTIYFISFINRIIFSARQTY